MDLTKITTPFGLLDEATQEALKAHGGPVEAYSGAEGWKLVSAPQWMLMGVYRVKPAQPKPREWWITGIVAHESEPAARRFRDELVAERPGVSFSPIIHVREVLE